ncbi:MAG: DinB family protein [Actinomycetes bacterium]
MTTERTDLPESLDERTTLLTMLDYTRKTAVAKCEGLSDADARMAPLPGSPMMTVSGVVSHMRWVEWSWIRGTLLGHDDEGPWTDEDPDREFHYRLDWPIADVVADYQAMAREHDEQITGWDLEMVAARRIRSGQEINLRWILFHLIEENARHNGHLDILRELADGVTGD